MSTVIKSVSNREKLRAILKAVLFSLAAALVAACQSRGVTEIEGPAQYGELLPERITLVTWNTQKLHDPKIAEDLSGLIRQHRPDLLFLQEVRIDELNSDEMGGYFAKGWSYPWPGGPTIGVLTLSNSIPISIRPVQTDWRELFVTAPKVSLLTEYPLRNGETLLGVNVHLLNFEPWEPFMLRAQLRDLELVMAQHEGPMVMAGDFNTWSKTRLALVDELTRRLKLEEITSFPQGRKTGDLDSALLHWVFGVHPELPLDRIYSRGLEAHSVQVLPNDSSDHRPVLVTLTLDSSLRDEIDAPLVVKCSNLPSITPSTALGSSPLFC
jgi:endonuclease/exonuclease/phosphatase (EEP) superfamily protein YafD